MPAGFRLCPSCRHPLRKACPKCGEEMRTNAPECPNCRSDAAGVALPAVRPTTVPSTAVACPACHGPVTGDPDVCPTCRAALRVPCPHCGESIRPQARVCKHCRRSTAADTPEPRRRTTEVAPPPPAPTSGGSIFLSILALGALAAVTLQGDAIAKIVDQKSKPPQQTLTTTFAFSHGAVSGSMPIVIRLPIDVPPGQPIPITVEGGSGTMEATVAGRSSGPIPVTTPIGSSSVPVPGLSVGVGGVEATFDGRVDLVVNGRPLAFTGPGQTHTIPASPDLRIEASYTVTLSFDGKVGVLGYERSKRLLGPTTISRPSASPESHRATVAIRPPDRSYLRIAAGVGAGILALCVLIWFVRGIRHRQWGLIVWAVLVLAATAYLANGVFGWVRTGVRTPPAEEKKEAAPRDFGPPRGS